MGVAAFDVGLFDEDSFNTVSDSESFNNDDTPHSLTNKLLSDNFSPSDNLVRLVSVSLLDYESVNDALRVLINSLILDTFSLGESLTSSLVTHAFQVLLNDSLSLVGSSHNIISKKFGDSLSFNEFLLGEIIKVLSDDVGLVDELNTNLTLLTTLVDSITLSESQKRLINKTLLEVLNFSDVITRFVTYHLTDEVLESDSLRSGLVQIINLLDNLSVSEVLSSHFFKILNNKPHVWFVKNNKPSSVVKVLKPKLFGENINKPDLLNVNIKRPKINKVGLNDHKY